ncbi:enterobactin ABC transporter substrate-binding protein [Arthrobacter sp. MYb229]|uniref:ABC transporter substrate-binding protein n=1 Tax=unclassified Arthrobacter TaxID=235627 RepID=UPI000CFB952D|nr:MULTISPECIES: iron-siderophore ABC transporter substrate-binding protein [unclassified Arthrobacter]PRA06904.1 enterobactin ABC transporter substrate-binding protein [Arthrobacter sp. MYb229]PRB47852.1 enterobactin ABC transporter substrate-binding protein [Arthrobacter sp. MYb216]
MHTSRLIGLTAALAAATLTLASCGGAATSETPAKENASADSGFPVTIEHFRGKTELAERPLRVAALDPSYVDATLLLGAELVAYTEYRKSGNPFPEYLGDVTELTEDAVNVGTTTEPDLEKLLAADPDIIISADVRQGGMYDQLNKIAPTVFSESTGPTWKENVVLLGETLGKKSEAEQAVADYETRAAAVGKEILAQQADTTYSLVRFAGEDTARLYATDSFIGEIMADMGIPRPKDAPDTTESIFVPLSSEEILKADAEVIFQSTWAPEGAEGDASRDQEKKFTSNPLWKKLTGEVLPVDDSIFLSSVSLQGANEVITQVAEHFDVDPQLS